MSLHNSPHASTHASSLSPPPQYLTERHSPDAMDQFYHDQPQMPQRRCTVPGYPASTYPSSYRPFHDPGATFDPESTANGVLSYPQAGRDLPFPLSGTQPAVDDMYLNQAPDFSTNQLQPEFTDSPMASRDYFDPSAFANQSPNPVSERNLIESIVHQALSAQKAFERGERFTVQERLAEITRVLHDLGLGKGVLGLDGALPPLVQDPPLPAGAPSASSLSPPLSLGASSSPLMYVGSIGGVEVAIPSNHGSGGAKRSAELDEGPNKAPKLTPPREMEKTGSASPGHSPPLPGITPGMAMNGVAMGSAPNLLSRSQASGLPAMHPPPLMHAHTFPGGLHAPHVSSPLAGLPYENMGVMSAPPPEPTSSYRSERTPPSAADSYVAHMYQPLPTQSQGHHPGYQISRPPSPHSIHSDDSDDDSDEHVKQEQGVNNVFGRSLAFPRLTPPKARTSDVGLAAMSHSANTLPPELKSEVDRVFFKFLNRICSNLDATDSKGEAIHQTLMAKKMARLDELPDFRPFKFRIQAFTNGFLEELASEGYPDEVIPMKKIKSYLWNQPFISRFNEDGKKAKSKGNHIWNIDARKLDGNGPMHWTFREFKRKIAGTPPGIAYHGHFWQWAPHVWDPQVSRANITATFSSPSLPSWLSWNDNVLSGTPSPDATNADIVVTAKVLGDSDEQALSHTFHLTIAPSAVDPAFVKSRRPSLAHDVRRNVSDSAVNRDGMRTRAGSTSSNPSDNHQVMQVLASAVSRVTHAAHAAQSHNGISFMDADQLAKQQQVLGVTAQAVADEVRAGPHPDAQGTASVLVAAAHSVVVGAAQLVVTDRVAQAARDAADPASMAPAQAPISVTEVSVATQSAVAHAVALNGPMATEVEVMMTANALIQQQQVVATNEALESTHMLNGAGSGVASSGLNGPTPGSILNGTASGSVSPQMGQIGDHRSRSMSSLGNSMPSMGGPMNVGLVTGLGPGLDGMSAINPMHGMTSLVSNGMQ